MMTRVLAIAAASEMTATGCSHAGTGITRGSVQALYRRASHNGRAVRVAQVRAVLALRPSHHAARSNRRCAPLNQNLQHDHTKCRRHDLPARGKAYGQTECEHHGERTAETADHHERG